MIAPPKGRIKELFNAEVAEIDASGSQALPGMPCDCTSVREAEPPGMHSKAEPWNEKN
jgi:hypothetical protein